MTDEKDFLNALYTPLDKKKNEILSALKEHLFNASFGFFNGHYHKNASGIYEADLYPIPVISVDGICDIEIDVQLISVSTKMQKENVLCYDFTKLCHHTFEAYGGKQYLEDFYTVSTDFEEFKENICKTAEKEIGFSFSFSKDISAEKLCKFLVFLTQEGFYY